MGAVLLVSAAAVRVDGGVRELKAQHSKLAGAPSLSAGPMLIE
jgi:hypothetical protein